MATGGGNGSPPVSPRGSPSPSTPSRRSPSPQRSTSPRPSPVPSAQNAVAPRAPSPEPPPGWTGPQRLDALDSFYASEEKYKRKKGTVGKFKDMKRIRTAKQLEGVKAYKANIQKKKDYPAGEVLYALKEFVDRIHDITSDFHSKFQSWDPSNPSIDYDTFVDQMGRVLRCTEELKEWKDVRPDLMPDVTNIVCQNITKQIEGINNQTVTQTEAVAAIVEEIKILRNWYDNEAPRHLMQLQIASGPGSPRSGTPSPKQEHKPKYYELKSPSRPENLPAQPQPRTPIPPMKQPRPKLPQSPLAADWDSPLSETRRSRSQAAASPQHPPLSYDQLKGLLVRFSLLSQDQKIYVLERCDELPPHLQDQIKRDVQEIRARQRAQEAQQQYHQQQQYQQQQYQQQRYRQHQYQQQRYNPHHQQRQHQYHQQNQQQYQQPQQHYQQYYQQPQQQQIDNQQLLNLVDNFSQLSLQQQNEVRYHIQQLPIPQQAQLQQRIQFRNSRR